MKTYDELVKEIERLTEENGQLKGYNDGLEYEVEQRQKQVDELTDKLGKVLSGIKADEVLTARGVEQAVKDTAKEILTNAIEGFVFSFTAYNEDYRNGYDEAIDDYDNKLEEFIKERYGVEVE